MSWHDCAHAAIRRGLEDLAVVELAEQFLLGRAGPPAIGRLTHVTFM